MLYVKVALLLAACFMMRPSALGQSFTPVAIALSLGALYLHFIEHSLKRQMFLTKHNKLILITSILFWAYTLVQAALMDVLHFDFVVKATAAHIVILLSAAVVLSDDKLRYVFFRAFIIVLLLLSASYCVTVALSFVVPFSQLLMFRIPVENYSRAGDTYFPFTVMYSFMNVKGIMLPRLLGLFREAGIYQAFLVWALFSLSRYNLNKTWIKLVLLCGIVGTFSTAGIGVLLAVYAVKLIVKDKRFGGLLVIPAMVVLLFYTPFIGLNSKSVTHGDSIGDRLKATLSGLDKFQEIPFGQGMYNESVANAGINLLSSMYMLGILGVLFLLAVYFAPLFSLKDKPGYLLTVLPLFLTVLVSQPIIDAPLVYVLLMAASEGRAAEMAQEQKTSRVSMLGRLVQET